MRLTVDGRSFEVSPGATFVVVDGREYAVRLERAASWLTVFVNDRPIQVAVQPGHAPLTRVLADAKEYEVVREGRPRPAPAISRVPPAAAVSKSPLPAGGIAAHMAGRILRIHAVQGQAVTEGEVLLVIEAMKMENEIRSPKAGTITNVAVAAGDRVQQGDLLVVVE